jgi:glycerol uptake facilitator-like aquaporin
MNLDLSRRLAAEFIGTAMLLAAVVGSGIMAERLSGGNAGIALLANSVATGAVLVALIMTFAGISGSHFNPAVTISAWIQRGITARDALAYISAQAFGAVCGVGAANVMFGLPVLFASVKIRNGGAQSFSEFIATFGLIMVVFGTSRLKSPFATPVSVAAYITAAYWFTASTSFANPAVTLARTMSDTLTGVRPADAPGFIAAQIVAALAATFLFRWLFSPVDNEIIDNASRK